MWDMRSGAVPGAGLGIASVGAFADPHVPAPRVSVWESRIQTSGVGSCSQAIRNVSVVRVAEPPSVAPSPMVSRLACASAGTRKWQRATEFTHSSRMFLNRFPPIQTLQRIDPGAGANVIRATSSKGCAARGGLGATESTSMRTSPVALCADDGSVVAAANTTAVNAASQLIMRFRVRSNSRGR